MSNFCPQLNFIYYKNILECSIYDYFVNHNDDFRKIGDGYVDSKVKSKTKLKKEFVDIIKNNILKLLKPFDLIHPNYYFIIGSCFPIDNILLTYNNENNYFPEKLKQYILLNPNLKYKLKEDDIKIDIATYNSIFEEIFDDLFINKKQIVKIFGNEYNINFIKHGKLGCYMLWRIFKNIYGKTNVHNLFVENKDMMKTNITSLNEEIEKYFNNKKELIKSDEFLMITNEIKQLTDKIIS